MKQLDIKDAYLSAFIFLNNIFQAKKSENIGSLLGDMQLLKDDSSADPAAVYDWRKAVLSGRPKVFSDQVSNQEELITNIEAYDAFCLFLQEYVNRTGSEDIQILVQDLIETKKYPLKSNSLISLWNTTVDFVQKNPETAREMVAFKFLKTE